MWSTGLYLLALASSLSVALAGPVEVRVTKTIDCNNDNLLRSMLDPKYSSSASAFCSTFIQPTSYVTTTTSVTSTVVSSSIIVVATATITTTAAPSPIIAPRAKTTAPATFTTFPAGRLSSACSCILTSQPATVTISSTVTQSFTTSVTTSLSSTATAVETCAPAAFTAPLVNGGFESGDFSSWTGGPFGSPSNTFGVISPGHNSNYLLRVQAYQADEPYSGGNAEQVLTTCPGQKYTIGFDFLLQNWASDTYLNVFVDGNYVYSINSQGYYGNWVAGTASFVAAGQTSRLTISLICTNYNEETLYLDNVSVTPTYS